MVDIRRDYFDHVSGRCRGARGSGLISPHEFLDSDDLHGGDVVAQVHLIGPVRIVHFRGTRRVLAASPDLWFRRALRPLGLWGPRRRSRRVEKIPDTLTPDESSRQIDGQLKMEQSDLAADPSIEPALDHLKRHRAFPLDVFPPKVRKFIREVAASRQCPLDFVALAVLVVAGTAIGAARVIRLQGDWDESTGIYGALVGTPGSSKTPALMAAIEPLKKIQRRLIRENRRANREFHVSLQNFHAAPQHENEAVDPLLAPAPPPPMEPLENFHGASQQGNEAIGADLPLAPTPPPPMQHLLSTDSTIEALAVNLQNSPKGILMWKDELQGFLRSRERSFYLSCWSNSAVIVNRKSALNEPIWVDFPLLGILGGIQPALLRTLLLQNTQDDGLVGRFLFVCPDSQKFPGRTNAMLSEQSKADWNDIVQQLYRLNFNLTGAEPHQPIVLPLNDNAANVQGEFHERIQADVTTGRISPALEATCLKMRSYFGRFALILRLLWAADRVSHVKLPANERRWRTNAKRVILTAGFQRREPLETGNPDDARIVAGEFASRAEQLCWYFLNQADRALHAGETQRRDEKVDSLVAWMARTGRTSCTARDVHRSEVAGVKSTAAAKALLSKAVDSGVGYLEKPEGRKSSRKFYLGGVIPTHEAGSNGGIDAAPPITRVPS